MVPGSIATARALSSDRTRQRDHSTERKRESSVNQDRRRPDSGQKYDQSKVDSASKKY
jgi:hypothetical protein